MPRGEELRKEANNVASLNVKKNQQDSKTEKAAVGTWSQRVRKAIRARATRAREGNEQCARRLQGNRGRAREKTMAVH